MPLQDLIPLIDDRRFAQLNDEVKARIPRYTSEWTDFNDSDPGIALAQLFAWMTELLTYRLNQVPELNYIKFLQLLGIELRAAQPAAAQIAFPVATTFTGGFVIVPQRTQVSANPPAGGAPVIFETDTALIALAATLASVLCFDGYSYSDSTIANTDAKPPGFQPFGSLAADGSALLLGFAIAGPFPRTEIDLAFWASSVGATPAPVTCGATANPAFAPAKLVWQFYDGANWMPLTVRKDETLAFTRTGHVRLGLPGNSTPQAASMAGGTALLYWVRAYLQKSQYASAPRLLAVRINTVAATQAETVQGEILGGSNGRPFQTFTLSQTPVLSGSLDLQVDLGDGNGFVSWTEVDDFFSSGPDDKHYLLDRTSGTITTGDGVNGAILVANPNNADANVVANKYRVGGGEAGNLPAGALSTLTTSVVGIDDSNVSNLFASAGGSGEETLDEAKRRAPLTIKSRDRAVTADDFVYLATQTADVKRAEALPLAHPDFPGVEIPGVVTVVVVPHANTDLTSGEFNPMPVPSDGTLRAVCAYLTARRLLTTELYVVAPTYLEIVVNVDVVVADTADLATVSSLVENAMKTYFHPLIGGDDGAGWPFGGAVYFSLVYRNVLNVSGVQSVNTLTITLAGQPAPPCTDVPIPAGALLYSVAPVVSVSYGSSS